MSNETGVVSEPDGGFELGQDIINSAAAGLDGLVDTLSAFFQVYLLTTTMFLLAVSVFFVVVYFIGKWPSQYGTQIQYKRTKRSITGLLLTCAIFPILYVAGWIGTSSTSHDGLPQDGIFGTGIEERLIGVTVGSDGLGMVVSVMVALFRTYLATLTTVFIAISVLYFSIRAVGKLQPYGEKMIEQRARRSYVGLFAISIILPLLYIPVWVATGTQSPYGYNLPADGVFGTSFEERLFGPSVGEGGFGQLVSILANVFHTYQVTISFFLVIALIFLAIGYTLVQWPNELANRGLRGRLKRVGLGVLASVSFIPILYAIGWVATGFYTPDESMTWVAPRIDLPYEELFTGPDYHPFIQDLSASSDPLEVVLRNLLNFQVLTLVYVGMAAVITGLLVYTVFDRTNILDTGFGEQSFRGGVTLLLIAFLIPFLITGAAWVATGVPDDGYLGDGPPGFSSECTGFETNQGGWETVEGHTSPVLEPAGMELDGTISQEFEEVGLGDRSVTIKPISRNEEFTIRMYEGGEEILNETTETSASYIVGADEGVRVEVSSDGGEINELCVGFEPVSDPQLDIALSGVAENEPLILRKGITMQYTVYNVGEVYTGSEFDVHLVLNGTDPWGEPSTAGSKTTLPPMAGGEFTDEVNRFNDLRGTPPTGRVEMFGVVDPYDQLDERTTVPNIDGQHINVVYANMYGHINATEVDANQTAIQTRVVNNGTIYSDETTAEVTIYDEDDDGRPIRSWSVPIDRLSANGSQTDSLEHTFRSPGNYTTEINVDEFLFPRGSVDTDSLQYIAPDLHGELVGVEDETRVDTPTEFNVSVQNKGNDRFDGQTNATVELVDSTGAVTQEKVITVPSLDEGEYHRQTVQMTPTTGGSHSVRLDVDYSLYPYGTTDSEDILSVGPSFTADISSPNRFQTETSDVTVDVVNNGNAESRSSQMYVALTHPNGTEIGNQTLNVPALDGGESHSVESPFDVELDDPGEYTVQSEVEPTLSTTGTSETSSFEVYSFNISMDSSPVEGTNEVRLDVGLENLADSRTGTRKEVELRVYDSSGELAVLDDVMFYSLNGGEKETRGVDVEVDNMGRFTAEAELQIGKRNTATTSFNQSWPDQRGAINATQTSVNGTESTVQTTVTNTGSATSEETVANIRLYDVENGRSRISTTTIDVPALNPGESADKPVSVEFPDAGVYEVGIDVADRDFPENNRDTTRKINVFQSEINIQVDERRGEILPGENGTVDVTISNTGSDESGTLPVQTEFRDPNWDTTKTVETEVGPIQGGESTTITYSPQLSVTGTHTVESTVTSDISGTDRGRASIDVVESELTMRVDAEQDQIAVAEDGVILAEIANRGTSESRERVVSAEIKYENGTVVDEWNTTVEPVEPGGSTTLRFQSGNLTEFGEYTGTVQLESKDSGQITGEDTIEVIESDLSLAVSAEQNRIAAADNGTFLVDVTNTGVSESQERPINATIEYENGTVIDRWEATVEPLNANERATFRVSSANLTEIGTYTGIVQLETGNSNRITRQDTIKVSPSALSANIRARNIEEGEPVDVTTTVRNTGLSRSTPTTATVRIKQLGSTVAEKTVDIQALDSGESQTNTLFETELDPGNYDAEIVVGTDGVEAEDYDRFEVGYWDLKADLVVGDETRVNQHSITVRIPNDGTVQSEPTTATVNITGPSGDIVKQQQIDVPAIEGGRVHTEDVSLQVDEGGEYGATLDVTDTARPAGTTDQEDFIITWGDLNATITASEEVKDNDAEFTVEVVNDGPGESYATAGTVNVRDNFGNILEQYSVDIPSLQSGETYETSVTYQFKRPGTYEGDVDVTYPEFPRGTADSTGDVKVTHGNLNGRVYFTYGSSDVETEADFTVQVTNTGNDLAESTTADVEIENRHGEIVYDTVIDVPPLAAGDSMNKRMAATLNTSGRNTVRVDVNYPEFPIGNQGEDDIDVVSPDLQTELDVEDTNIGEHTNVTMTIVNDGEMTSASTVVDVVMYNDNDRQVVSEEFGVRSLGPGESVEIKYSQLIAPECWRTEMTCEPGASITHGEYLGEANVDSEYAEQGTIAEDTFTVEEAEN